MQPLKQDRVAARQPAGIARAGYHGDEFLPGRSGADGSAAPASARCAVSPYRAASRSPRRTCRRPSRRMRAARRPPHAGAAPARQVRPRCAVHRISPGLSRTGEGRVRRVRHSRDVDPQGHHGLAGQISCRRQARLYVPVQSGRVRPRLPDQRHRRLRQAAQQFRQRGAEGEISRRPDPDRHEQADAGRPVHDREGRRLRRRHADDDGRAGRRSLAALLARSGSAPMRTPKW